MRTRTLRHFAAAAVLAVLTLPTACGGGDAAPPASEKLNLDGDSPLPEAESESWRSDYDADQLAAYESALQRWETYEELLEPIEAEGRATPEAKKLFRQHFSAAKAKDKWNELKMFEEMEVRSTGQPEVLWSRATAINDAADSVTIEQCVDWRPTNPTQHGKPLPPVAERQKPVLRVIDLGSLKGEWLVYAIVTTPGKDGKEDVQCDPAQ